MHRWIVDWVGFGFNGLNGRLFRGELLPEALGLISRSFQLLLKGDVKRFEFQMFRLVVLVRFNHLLDDVQFFPEA